MKNNLLANRRFWPLFWTQFLGAFNDNLFKNALVILITFKGVSFGSISTSQMVAICGGIFILPFFLFSATAGQLADKYSKSQLMVLIKIWEILVMLLAAYGFVAHKIFFLMICLFLMGLHSTFFGPAKYSILPQLLGEDELVTGNGYVEMGTFIAILLGTISGGVLIAIHDYGPWMVGVAALVVASCGLLTSTRIKPLAPVVPDLPFQLNPVTPTIRIMRLTANNKTVFLSILGISWFWFLGAAILALLPPYCKDLLKADESVVTLLLAMFSVGVGAGSLLCARLSFRKLEVGLVPLGTIGISLFACDLYFVGQPNLPVLEAGQLLSPMGLLTTLAGWRIVVGFFFLCVFSGFFTVPLYTLLQQRSEKEERSRIIAGNNVMGALFMVVSAIFLVALFRLKFTIPQIFLTLSLLNLLVGVVVYAAVPEFLFRFVCWLVANILYRAKVMGRNNIPNEGPALLICNHIGSWDWMIIASTFQRPVRFVTKNPAPAIPSTFSIMRSLKPKSATGSRRNIPHSKVISVQAIDELKRGGIVCIFSGEFGEDKESIGLGSQIEIIVKEMNATVVPVRLNGRAGGVYDQRRRFFRASQGPWRRASLVIGTPIRPEEFTVDAFSRLSTERSPEERATTL